MIINNIDDIVRVVKDANGSDIYFCYDDRVLIFHLSFDYEIVE